jgi:ubiquinone/menaquinone biosynthesis C-methylase UbiE
MDEPTPNAGATEFWNGSAGDHWVEQAAVYDAMHAGIAIALVDALAPVAGEHILDVGAGTGTLARTIGALVRPRGHVTALDVSAPMIGRAAEIIVELELGDVVSVLQTDAQVHPFRPASYDGVTSRFGVMFFDDPVAAFANLCRATRRGGRLAFASWQPAAVNEFMELPNAVVRRYLDVPDVAPGVGDPFSLGDPTRTEEILTEAGWTNVVHTALEGSMLTGGPASIEEATDFTLARGHIKTRLADASPEVATAIRDDLLAEFTSRYDGEGVRLAYAAWLVTATRPT